MGEDAAQSDVTRATGKARWLLASVLWATACVSAATVASWAMRGNWGFIPWSEIPTPPLSVGQILGIVTGLFIAIRHGRLLGWILGPTLGFLVGTLDRVSCRWLLVAGLPEGRTWMVPVAGVLCGWLVASLQPTGRRAGWAFAGVVLADFLGRLAASACLEAFQWGILGKPGALNWPTEWIAYAPCMTLAVLVSARASAIAAPSRVRVATWRCAGIGLAAALVSLWAWERHVIARLAERPTDRESPVEQVTHRARWVVYELALVERLFRQAGIRLKPQASPSTRSLHPHRIGYDPDRKVGYLLVPDDDLADFRTTGFIAGLQDVSCDQFLSQPWSNERALVLVVRDFRERCKEFYVPEWGKSPPPDSVKSAEICRGLEPARDYRFIVRTEQKVAAFLDLVARRDEGEPLREFHDAATYLSDLERRYGRFAPELDQARLAKRPFVAVLGWCPPATPGLPGRARILECSFHCAIPVTFRTLHSQAALPASRTARFWVNRVGRIIGDETEAPPDGYSVSEWSVETGLHPIEYEDCWGEVGAIDVGPGEDDLARTRDAEGR